MAKSVSKRGLGAAGLGIVLATTSAGVAAAQTKPGATSETQGGLNEVSQVVVTASRITRPGFVAPTPTTVLTQDDIEAKSATNIADLINTLPEARASQTPASSSNNSAQASGNYVDLRGLGPQRTLVLLNGQRFVPSSTVGDVNINEIPQAAISSVEVVTGGASAAWGSDAVAGVVNFRLDNRLEGVRATAEGSATEHDDNEGYLFSGAIGHRFDGGKGHILIAGELFDNNGVTRQDSRDFGKLGYAVISNPNYTATNAEPLRLIEPNVRLANATLGGLVNSGALKGQQFTGSGALAPFSYGSLVTAGTMVGGDGAFSQAYSVLEVPLERQNIYARLDYDVSEALSLYVDALYARSRSEYTSDFPTDTALTIRSDNGFLQNSIRAQLAAAGQTSFSFGRFGADFAGVDQTISNDTARISAGAKGKLGDIWSWDAYATYGQNLFSVKRANNRIPANFTLALDAVVNPATGQVVCRSTLANPNNGCVPINLFGLGNVSPGADAYVSGTGFKKDFIEQSAGGATVRGAPLHDWAGPIDFAAGFEIRRDTNRDSVDPTTQAGGFFSGRSTPWTGAESVQEGFGEVLVPLLRDVPLAKSLDFNAAGRVTHYSTSGTVETWKVGATDKVTEDLLLRVTRSKDIRAPNLGELFSGLLNTTAAVIDPTTGVQSTVINAASGNPSLVPEEADTLTYGFVWSPHFVPRLRLSVDYYEIDVQHAITTLTAASIVSRCYSVQTQLCSLITRTNGVISSVAVSPVNLQDIFTRGFDVELDYRRRLDTLFRSLPGEASFHGLVTYVDRLDLNDGVTTTHLAGTTEQLTISSIGGQPHLRYNLRGSYDLGPFRTDLTVRYVAGGRISSTYTSKDINILTNGDATYLDWYARLRLLEGKRNLEVFAAVDNLLDEQPPISPGSGYNAFSTVRSLYDQIGRTFRFGLRASF